MGFSDSNAVYIYTSINCTYFLDIPDFFFPILPEWFSKRFYIKSHFFIRLSRFSLFLLVFNFFCLVFDAI